MAARLKSTPGAYGWVNRNPILELSCNPIVTSLSIAASLIVAFTIGDRASSAELADRRPVRARPAHPLYDWTGPYIGINAGYGFGRSQTDALFTVATIGTALLASTPSSRLDGLILGTQAGYNWQAGRWLFGLEADIQASN